VVCKEAADRLQLTVATHPDWLLSVTWLKLRPAKIEPSEASRWSVICQSRRNAAYSEITYLSLTESSGSKRKRSWLAKSWRSLTGPRPPLCSTAQIVSWNYFRKKNSDIHCYETRSAHLLHFNQIKTVKYGEKSLFSMLLSAFNKVSHLNEDVTCTSVFKFWLKRYIEDNFRNLYRDLVTC